MHEIVLAEQTHDGVTYRLVAPLIAADSFEGGAERIAIHPQVVATPADTKRTEE
jgi:hypothetical protein